MYSIWNLNFLTLIPVPFCIPGIRTAVGVILLEYVIAACPVLFIIVSYTWIQCYNNGYRLVVYTTRPVHRLLARFWQRFKIQPSLIDTYAGLLLLAYMRFLAVSVKLLMFITLDSKFASSQVAPVPLVIIPILCLLVFVILPMAVLLLYPFKIFQRCLTCCRLDRPGLHALVDAYQGCFKNSATDGQERRYFAGIYLLFRFFYVAVLVFFLNSVIFIAYLVRQNTAWLIALPSSIACLSFLLAGLVLILQPYRKTSHNIIDFLTLFFMSLVAALTAIFNPLFFSILPLFVLLCYLIYRVIKCCCCCCTTRRSSQAGSRDNESDSSVTFEQPPITISVVGLGDYGSEDDDSDSSEPSEQQPLLVPPRPTTTVDDYEDDEYPDRLVHPEEYRTCTL